MVIEVIHLLLLEVIHQCKCIRCHHSPVYLVIIEPSGHIVGLWLLYFLFSRVKRRERERCATATSIHLPDVIDHTIEDSLGVILRKRTSSIDLNYPSYSQTPTYGIMFVLCLK